MQNENMIEPQNPQCVQTSVSGSGFFEINKYYRKKNSRDIDCIYYFKCEELINSTDAFGIELVITPGKKLFHIHCSAHFIFSEWEEISNDEFKENTENYINQVSVRFR